LCKQQTRLAFCLLPAGFYYEDTVLNNGMILLHGTTRKRAEQIVRDGPNPRYREPGGIGWNDGFSTYLEEGPYLFKPPEYYATGKAKGFPSEGGPVILVMEVPEDIVMKAATDDFTLGGGLIQFDRGAGMEELLAAWPNLLKTIREIK
jgi:hypothetical protein